MSHSAENPKESSMLAKFWFLVRIEGSFDKNKLEKKPHSSEKPPVLKTRNAVSGIRNIRNSLYPVSAKSGMGCVIVEEDSLALFTALKIFPRNVISGIRYSL